MLQGPALGQGLALGNGLQKQIPTLTPTPLVLLSDVRSGSRSERPQLAHHKIACSRYTTALSIAPLCCMLFISSMPPHMLPNLPETPTYALAPLFNASDKTYVALIYLVSFRTSPISYCIYNVSTMYSHRGAHLVSTYNIPALYHIETGPQP